MSGPPPGLHVHRRAGAAPADPVVVCIHGAADRGAAFARVGRFLQDVDLVRLDRRGYGRSLGPVPGAEVGGAEVLAGQVADVVGVLDWVLGDHRANVPVIVVGHSHGALVALATALDDDRISGVVAWEPPMPWASWWSSSTGTTAGAAARRAAAAGSSDSAGDAMESFLRRMLGDDRWEALGESVRAARRQEGPALLADLEAARAAGALAIDTVGVPVVLGVGGATPPRHQRAVRELADGLGATADGAGSVRQVEVVEVPDADHGAHLTHPAEVAAAIRRCLSMVAEAAGTLPP